MCSNECFIHDINTEESYPSSISGGIGLQIKNIDNVPGVSCPAIGCGKYAGDKEIEDLLSAGVMLTEEDKVSLRDFFSIMYCEIFDCFREGQLNPGSNIDLFLEDVKDKLLSSPNKLQDGCDDLSPYVDRWTQLASFDANSINSVKNRLKQLGDEYWIQTLENATNAGSFWWKTAPSVNMDFFGLKITKLPNKPYPPFNQFTHTEFLEYIRRNWTSSSFFGDGNSCQGSVPFFKKSFEYAYPQDAFIWTGNNGVSTIFTIKMPDDGSVICSQHNSGDYWVFSTLNAPRWLMADNEPGLNSWDGYHPVSGNRQFGILDNNDGSFTFYTSGVDRLSGWWHATAEHILGLTPLGTPFEQADELWTCFLNNVKSYIELNGGTTNVQFDCTTVRPKWSELRNAIKKGCEGLSSSITKFPCKQAKSCE